MANSARDEASKHLDEHERSIDALHRNLESVQGMDRERLRSAVHKYKAAHASFRDDALGCMN
jgi:hypothetical protein